ncbi:MAG: methylated-DNA--[protein]-cysteine S-methyltransferase [Anaerolineae bacterium]|nr:methylated-DNA--[protein]-cysteine S-methyltransferase [Anaerolineae bacterium]
MMTDRTETEIRKTLEQAVGGPNTGHIEESRRRVDEWFESSAPRIAWDMFDSPLGAFYVAATEQGVCSIVFGKPQADFFATLDPLARLERDSAALAGIIGQIRAYFGQPHTQFDMPVDLSGVSPFHRAALETVRGIPAGSVMTYKQVAEELGRPKSSRAVGQAMAHNPVPLVIPCHRVVGSSGKLTGYGGGGGIPTKRRLLQMEGAI